MFHTYVGGDLKLYDATVTFHCLMTNLCSIEVWFLARGKILVYKYNAYSFYGNEEHDVCRCTTSKWTVTIG